MKNVLLKLAAVSAVVIGCVQAGRAHAITRDDFERQIVLTAATILRYNGYPGIADELPDSAETKLLVFSSNALDTTYNNGLIQCAGFARRGVFFNNSSFVNFYNKIFVEGMVETLSDTTKSREDKISSLKIDALLVSKLMWPMLEVCPERFVKNGGKSYP
jgi:hypothetical protein